MSTPRETCLVLKNDGLGDLVLASGLIADLAGHYDVDLVTCRANREVAEAIPGLRRVHYTSRNGMLYHPALLRLGIRFHRPCAEDATVLRHLRETPYDLAISLRRYITQSTLMMMRRVRAQRRLCAWLFPTNCDARLAHRQSEGWEHHPGSATVRSELDYYRGFLQGTLRLPFDGTPRLLGVVPGDRPPEPRRVGLCISGASTNWPAEHWSALTTHLAARDCALVLFGGTDAEALANRLMALAPRAENLVGRRTLRQAVPDLQRLALLVGNDTGFTHFASLATARVLVILGGGTFGRFFPWPGPRSQSTIFRAMDCFDCDWQCQFERRECLWGVGPEAVATGALSLLDREAGAAGRAINLNADPVEFTAGWRRTSGAFVGERVRLEPGAKGSAATSPSGKC